ncbi:MAG: helix-turn-helix domain-containing protein [Clostridia bacterium]|nr:helix-turn-helix domain-containing protein [Clostridia bacterium]
MKNENLENLPKEKTGVKRVLDSTEAAQYLGISYWLIRKLVREKKIPYYKIESKTLFTKEILDKYIEDSLEEPKKEKIKYDWSTF